MTLLEQFNEWYENNRWELLYRDINREQAEFVWTAGCCAMKKECKAIANKYATANEMFDHLIENDWVKMPYGMKEIARTIGAKIDQIQ